MGVGQAYGDLRIAKIAVSFDFDLEKDLNYRSYHDLRRVL
jgi:hypothetical protein